MLHGSKFPRRLVSQNLFGAFLALACFALMAGCRGRSLMIIEGDMPPMPTKPAPFPEMRMLDVMVGTWTGTGEIIDPTPDEMRAMMPESERANYNSNFSGGSTGKFELDGAVLRSEGWYQMPGNQKGTFLEYWTWDPREGRFRTWFASDWSESGSGWVTPSVDGRCFHVEGRSTDAAGARKKFEGCMCVVDNDTLDWQFTEKGPMGRYTMQGTSRRQK